MSDDLVVWKACSFYNTSVVLAYTSVVFTDTSIVFTDTSEVFTNTSEVYTNTSEVFTNTSVVFKDPFVLFSLVYKCLCPKYSGFIIVYVRSILLLLVWIKVYNSMHFGNNFSKIKKKQKPFPLLNSV